VAATVSYRLTCQCACSIKVKLGTGYTPGHVQEARAKASELRAQVEALAEEIREAAAEREWLEGRLAVQQGGSPRQTAIAIDMQLRQMRAAADAELQACDSQPCGGLAHDRLQHLLCTDGRASNAARHSIEHRACKLQDSPYGEPCLRLTHICG
jgi:hypothetical protein